jgi:DNA-binding beta-propeller fold protein YncE
VVTYAGTGAKGYAEGPALSAQFHEPSGIVRDGEGNLYVSDTDNRRVRVISPAGQVSTLFGTGERGKSKDGPFSSAMIMKPGPIAIARDGTIYVADDAAMGVRIARRREQKVESIVNVKFHHIAGLAVAPDGAIWVSDIAYDGKHIFRIELGQPPRVFGRRNTMHSTWDDGPADKAALGDPRGLVVDAQGTVHFADSGNQMVRSIGRDGTVSSIAGAIWMAPFGKSHRDGGPYDARFYGPSAVALDARGRIIVADTLNHRIRRVEPNKSVTTIAGSGKRGLKNGPPLQAEFNNPCDVEVGDDGTIYVADRDNHCIRAIRP